MWSNDPPEDLGSHGYVLESEIFEIEASFNLRFANFLPTYQRDFPVIMIAPFPEELMNEDFHFFDDAWRCKKNRELKNGEATENKFDEDSFVGNL